MSIVLKLKKSDYDKILKHCKDGLPNESCGLLAGTVEGEVKTVTKIYLLTNIDASNEHFSMIRRSSLPLLRMPEPMELRLSGTSILIRNLRQDRPRKINGWHMIQTLNT